jgi:hypothetical protein
MWTVQGCNPDRMGITFALFTASGVFQTQVKEPHAGPTRVNVRLFIWSGLWTFTTTKMMLTEPVLQNLQK